MHLTIVWQSRHDIKKMLITPYDREVIGKSLDLISVVQIKD